MNSISSKYDLLKLYVRANREKFIQCAASELVIPVFGGRSAVRVRVILEKMHLTGTVKRRKCARSNLVEWFVVDAGSVARCVEYSPEINRRAVKARPLGSRGASPVLCRGSHALLNVGAAKAGSKAHLPIVCLFLLIEENAPAAGHPFSAADFRVHLAVV